MKEKNAIYYLIRNRIIGKREKDSECFDYLYKDGEWVPDKDCVIMDHLVGYDPHEPADSPYIFGNLSIMEKIEEISYEEAMDRIRKDKENNK